MSVIFNALNFYPEIVGNGKYTSEMIFWISKRVDKVIVITTNPYYPEWVCPENKYKKEILDNITIFRCPIYVPKKVNGFTKILHYLSFSLTSFPIALYSLRYKPKLIFTICPSIFSVTSSLAICIISKVFLKKKVFSWIHFQDLEIEAAFNLNILRGKNLKKVILSFEKYIINKFDFISSISNSMVEKIKLKLIKNKEIILFPNFIKTSDFKVNYKSKLNNPFIKDLSIDGKLKIIMYSGTLNEKLSYKTLTKTISLLNKNNILWIISGEGPLKKKLQKNLSAYKNVIFTSFQPEEKFVDWIHLADIHLIPQRINTLDLLLPSKLLAILSSGKPIVGFATKDSDLGRILDNSGIRVSEENPYKFSEVIIKLLDDQNLIDKFSKNGIDYVSNFHEKEKVLNEIYKKVKKII